MRRIVTILEETVEVTLQPNSSSETENATPSSSNSFQELRGNFFSASLFIDVRWTK